MSTRTRRQRPTEESSSYEAEDLFSYESAYGLDDDITDVFDVDPVDMG